MANINQYFLTLFCKLFLANFMFCLAFLFMVLALSFQQILLYCASSMLWIICLLYLFKQFMQLKNFEQNIDFKDENDMPEVKFGDSDYVKVCKFYVNGGLKRVKDEMRLSDRTAAMRMLKKAIAELIKRNNSA